MNKQEILKHLKALGLTVFKFERKDLIKWEFKGKYIPSDGVLNQLLKNDLIHINNFDTVFIISNVNSHENTLRNKLKETFEHFDFYEIIQFLKSLGYIQTYDSNDKTSDKWFKVNNKDKLVFYSEKLSLLYTVESCFGDFTIEDEWGDYSDVELSEHDLENIMDNAKCYVDNEEILDISELKNLIKRLDSQAKNDINDFIN